jgi:hypothetical protein
MKSDPALAYGKYRFLIAQEEVWHSSHAYSSEPYDKRTHASKVSRFAAIVAPGIHTSIIDGIKLLLILGDI